MYTMQYTYPVNTVLYTAQCIIPYSTVQYTWPVYKHTYWQPRSLGQEVSGGGWRDFLQICSLELEVLPTYSSELDEIKRFFLVILQSRTRRCVEISHKPKS